MATSSTPLPSAGAGAGAGAGFGGAAAGFGIDGIEGVRINFDGARHHPASQQQQQQQQRLDSDDHDAPIDLDARQRTRTDRTDRTDRSGRSTAQPLRTPSAGNLIRGRDGTSHDSHTDPSRPTATAEPAQTAGAADPDLMVNLAAAKANPKFQRMVQHIDSLVERTRGVRSEMEQMMQITRELHDQCALQERECAALEGDQAKVKEEIETLTARIQSLMTDKMQTEQRLEELRLENAKLDSYLQQARETSNEEI